MKKQLIFAAATVIGIAGGLYFALDDSESPTLEPQDFSALEAMRSGDMLKLQFGVNRGSDVVFINEDGTDLTLAAFEGKYLLVNFWATWCPGCRAELPQIMDLKNQFKDEVHFISVTNETFDIIEASGEYDKHGDFIYFTPYFSRQFDFSAYPSTFIIDSDFNIIQKIEGASKLNSDKNILFLKGL